MSAEIGGGLGTVATLVIGAVGALAAIFLKEAVQAAMQRRILAWQLFGYLLSWRRQIIKNAAMANVYEKIKERNLALTKAAARSTTEFKSVHQQQHKDLTELRDTVKAGMIEAFSKADVSDLHKVLNSMLITEAASSFAEQRKLLADSKSFISDRDAAMLGKGTAIHVVQFRTSLLYLLLSFEGVLKLIPHEADDRPKIIADLVDNMIVYGEEVLVAMIRLEQNVESISRKSIFQLTIDILMGR
jgi:hypothetical protein